FLAYTFAVNVWSAWLAVPSIQPLVLLSQERLGDCVMYFCSPSNQMVPSAFVRPLPWLVATTMSLPAIWMPLPSHSLVPSVFMWILIVSMKLAWYLPVIWPTSLFSSLMPLGPMSLMLKLSVLPSSSAITSPLVCC